MGLLLLVVRFLVLKFLRVLLLTLFGFFMARAPAGMLGSSRSMPELGPEEGDELFAAEALLGAALDFPVLDTGEVDETDGVRLEEEVRIGAELAPGLDKAGVLLGWADNVEIWFEEAEGMLIEDDDRSGAELVLDREETALEELRAKVETEEGTWLLEDDAAGREEERGAQLERALDEETARIGAELALGLDMLMGWLENMETGFEEAEGIVIEDEGRTGAELALGREETAMEELRATVETEEGAWLLEEDATGREEGRAVELELTLDEETGAVSRSRFCASQLTLVGMTLNTSPVCVTISPGGTALDRPGGAKGSKTPPMYPCRRHLEFGRSNPFCAPIVGNTPSPLHKNNRICGERVILSGVWGCKHKRSELRVVHICDRNEGIGLEAGTAANISVRAGPLEVRTTRTECLNSRKLAGRLMLVSSPAKPMAKAKKMHGDQSLDGSIGDFSPDKGNIDAICVNHVPEETKIIELVESSVIQPRRASAYETQRGAGDRKGESFRGDGIEKGS
ncbi:hypothetical protein K438DRAFT_1754101 [Mycena galopus ATCC 62051]|nr:hypothetical protein K438DRAFT_1754101 [Mycena galopus ATCC 62051]